MNSSFLNNYQSLDCKNCRSPSIPLNSSSRSLYKENTLTESIIYFSIAATLVFLGHWIYTQHIVSYFYHRKSLPWLNTQYKNDCYEIFNRLYDYENTMREARAARHAYGLDDDDSFTYGEIDFIYFAQVLEIVNPQPGELMLDLGSGGGKAVFCAALLYPSVKVVGIEILEGLHNFSANQLAKFEKLMDEHPRLSQQSYEIEFIHNDIMNMNIHNATIIFINATCYDDKFLAQLSLNLNVLDIGSRVIITTHALFNQNFEEIYKDVVLMSWGLCEIRVYQRVR